VAEREGDELDGPGGGWALDPRARTAMLLEASREALARGEAATAVALAEELLDEDPDDPDALLVIVNGAPRYGHAEVGVLAAEHARRRGLRPGAAEAAALFAACEVQRALDCADAVLAAEPDDPRAHALRGQALEILGREPEADEALRRAAALRPDAYPLPFRVDPGDWDGLLLAAISGLPTHLRDALRTIDLELRELPELTELRALDPPPSPAIDVLYSERPGERPKILLFRRNLARGSVTQADVVARIRSALDTEARILLEEEEG
jgi:tetratricopeptide (TPR) repeat protein